MTKVKDAPLVPRDLSPRQVAEMHYQSVVQDNRPRWLATLNAHEFSMADKRGSSPDFWWETGRRYATEFGVTYHFDREDFQGEKRAKLFFKRIQADGSQRGRPVPIHLVLEEDGWRVRMVTY